MKTREQISNDIKTEEMKDKQMASINKTSAEVNAEGMVLLKNDGMLPLKKGERIAVFGRLQRAYYKSGTGSGGLVNTSYKTNIYDALKNLGYIDIDLELAQIYDDWIEKNPFDLGDGWTQPWAQNEMPLSDEVVKKSAQKSDKAIVIIGRTAGEDKDNSTDKGSYLLTDAEYDMLRKVSKFFDKVCVILNTGNIIDMKWAKELPVNAVMYVWQGGQDGGAAVADVLCGKKYPSGKLSDTIAENIEDYPGYADFVNIDENIYTEDVFVGYRYFETFAKEKVMYPFGFGLSYTNFEINVCSAKCEGERICIEAEVKNIGEYNGKEVIQVYYEGIGEKLSRPARELVAFIKTKELVPDEKQNISISFKISDMAVYDDMGITGNKSCFVLEKGIYNIYLGTDVRSAEKVITYQQIHTKVVKKLSERMVPIRDFDRIVNNNGKVDYETVQGTEKDCKFEKKSDSDLKYIGDKGIKLADVYNRKYSIEDFVAQLSDFDLICISQGEGMNSAKVRPGTGGTFGGVTKELQDFGIPAVCVTDGPSGLRFDNGDVATSLPNGTMLACTWNDELAEKLYTYEGMEGYKNRVDGLLGPGINIHRLPLCGRNFEYLSEDPYLSGKIAVGMCKGLQNGGITGTIKHFAANNKEENRKEINMVISERALREIYLKPFEMVVKSNTVTMLMTAYNRINGVYCVANYDLNTAILRDEWGYDGLVMSDWWTKTSYDKLGNSHEERAYPVFAQNDLYMVNPDAEKTAQEAMSMLEKGIVSRAELVRNAINILKVILKTPTLKKYLDGDVIGLSTKQDVNGMTCKLKAENIKSGDEIEIVAEVSNTYILKIEYGSDKSELMQIPVKIYLDNANAGVCMVRGTGGKKEKILSKLYMIKGKHKLKLNFDNDSLISCMLEIYS